MIELLRTAFAGDDSREDCRYSGVGPARTQVLTWSARRLIDLLQFRGRRRLDLNPPGAAELTGQERTLAAMFAALDAGDTDGALGHAQWLVPTAEAKRLVRWAQPVVECGGRARQAA